MVIRLNQLQEKETEVYARQYSIFTDLALDVQFNYKDIQVALDERAIKNSLISLFNTRPGENILLPEYGLDLSDQLFEQLTEINGKWLAIVIRKNIRKFEPRVTVNKVDIKINTDLQQYEVAIEIEIPALKHKAEFTGIFDQISRFTTT